jgi:hypothetical protein
MAINIIADGIPARASGSIGRNISSKGTAALVERRR